MTVFVDSSAMLKLYLAEPDSERFEELLNADPDWVLACHARVEVRRALALRLDDDARTGAREQFEDDWGKSQIVEVDEAVCEQAVAMAEATGARTLDALHLAAAQRVGGGALPFVTADLRQAQIARSLGWVVLGS